MHVVSDARDEFALERRAAGPAHHGHAGIRQIGQRGGRGELPLRGKPLDRIYHCYAPTFWPPTSCWLTIERDAPHRVLQPGQMAGMNPAVWPIVWTCAIAQFRP